MLRSWAAGCSRCPLRAVIKKLRNSSLSCLLGSPPDGGAILRGQPAIHTQVFPSFIPFSVGWRVFFFFQLNTHDCMIDAVCDASQGPGSLDQFFFLLLGVGPVRWVGERRM